MKYQLEMSDTYLCLYVTFQQDLMNDSGCFS